jgi:uncharacterized protein YebE (UPF0316 family)
MDFLMGNSIWVYLFIFFGKILEVSVSTVRLVLINRGERTKGAILAFFDILLWVMITGTVLAGFQSDWFRLVIFAAAFAIGNYIGSWIEDKLAFGLSSVQVIVSECEETQAVTDTLRASGLAVTVLHGEGKDGERKILMLHLKRKRIRQAVNIVKFYLSDAMIVVNDAKNIFGGYIRK